MDFTGLVVPVPSVDWLVLDRRPASDGLRVPAHVTLIAPFVPPDELTEGLLAELATLFSDVVPFSFALQETAAFPDGTVYLAPEPAAPFRQLTHALAKAFPEYPPYEGRFETVVPHVTVPLLDHESVDDVARLVAEREETQGWPRGYAQEAQLLVVHGDDLDVGAEFPFGMAAA
jgi:hypothetical protein